MKKPISALFIILCLLFTLSLISCKISVKHVKASQTIWTVGNIGSADFTKIQEAINNESVAVGDTIFVHIGTYYENVVINKSLSIVGEDVDLTIVDGQKNGTVISIEANNVIFTGFTVKKSGAEVPDSAIRISHYNNIVLSNNKIRENTVGISLSFSSNNIISNNTVSSNILFGVSLSFCSDNVISGNVISENDEGIYLYSCTGNVISGNLISGNYDGIYLHSCTGNVISGNLISGNYDGIYLTSCSNNTIYHNNFNNTRQALSDSKNFWTYNGEGNYWSDYIGQDTNKDGIGSNPYRISLYNQDDDPLMGMFSDLNIAFIGETYYVSVVSNSTISGLMFEIGEETGNKMVRFNATGKGGDLGFCRIMIPADLMKSPYIVLINGEEVIPTLLNVSNETYSYLYFTYVHDSRITIISSKTLQLYNELFDQYAKSQMNLYNLNLSYYEILNKYNNLLGNCSQLEESYSELNISYNEHLSRYYEQMQDILNLRYLLAATAGILIIVTIYLSKGLHAGMATKAKTIKDEK